jgi:hypothetical protein
MYELFMDPHKAIQFHKQMLEEGKIPPILYKHTSISNNLYKTLINSELWFSAPTSFNDPFDCQINDQTEWTDELLLDYVTRTAAVNKEDIDPQLVIQTNKLNPGSFSKYFTKKFKQTLSTIGVTCFLQRPDNLLLWAHYSASHTGVCLKFDITEDPELFALTFAVKYSDEYPSFDYLKERDKLVTKAILTKSSHWKYEDEVRTLQKNSGSYPFNKNCLKEIIFGCNASQNEIKTIKNIVDSAGYPDLKLRQVKLLENEYNIEIVDL